MYFYAVHEVLPTLVMLGASFLLLGSLGFVAFVLWKAAVQLTKDARTVVFFLGESWQTVKNNKRGRSLAPVFVTPSRHKLR